MILFRGREQSRPEQGVRLLQKFAEEVSEFGTIESTPTIDGRNMVMIIGPLRSKSEARAEQKAKQSPSKKSDASAPKAEEAAEPAVEAAEVVAEEKAPAVKKAPAAKAAKAPKSTPSRSEELDD
jgi:translation initiation factor IF-3